MCFEMKLQLQGLEVQQKFYLFDLHGVDVVLGLEWLGELGEIKANFKEFTLKFKKEGKGVQGFLIDCYMTELKQQPEEPCPESVQQLLQEFAEVYKLNKVIIPDFLRKFALVYFDDILIYSLDVSCHV
uniref:Uncharacterized protein n=1 Tax=Cajanus cajan TaxID=3821 RepID=A0A151UCC0_CAJCA|nr:hypothetical protein KK1_021233 [Cajanus cajan]